MKILYIFPHPDDESFGPVGAMHDHIQDGHEVYLLTLTKGGATKIRFKLGLNIEEMGEVRYLEMRAVEAVLKLTGMTVWDFIDSGLKEMDPRILEAAIQRHIQEIKPDIVVSYPVHGISGFHDHLITHAVVKRAYLEMKDNGADYLRRLAFFTVREIEKSWIQANGFRLKNSEDAVIDCIMNLEEEHIDMMRNCLNCYVTYQSVIKETDIIRRLGTKLYFEFFNEDFKPPIKKITNHLPI